MNYLLSAIIWIMIAMISILISLIELLLFPLALIDRKRKLFHNLSSVWGRLIVKCNPFWKFEFEGLENIDPKKTYVVVANHQSMGDIFTLFYLRMQFRWMAKDSLFKIPFVGWSMFFSGYIPLKRGNTSSIRESMEAAKKRLKMGVSVLIFPEGTRSETGKLLPFKNGAFKLADSMKVDILPVSIQGTHEMLPKHSWVFNKKVTGKIKVFPSLPAAPAEELKQKTIQLLSN